VSELVSAVGESDAIFELELEPGARSGDQAEREEFFSRLLNLASASKGRVTFGVVSTSPT
jgi:hypothetical protein